MSGKYLKLMDEVENIVNIISSDVGRRPLATFFVTNNEKITTFYSHPLQLPLVPTFFWFIEFIWTMDSIFN